MSWIWTDNIDVLLAKEIGHNVYVVSSDCKYGRPGVTTTHATLESGTIRTQELLLTRTLEWATDLVSDDKDKNKRELETQLQSYRMHRKDAKDPRFASSKTTFSGKAPGQKDDLVTALTQVVERSSQLRIDERFQERMNVLGRIP